MDEEIFRAVMHDDKYYIIVGNTRVSQLEFETKHLAQRYIKSKPWELIGNICTLICRNIIQDCINEHNSKLHGIDSPLFKNVKTYKIEKDDTNTKTN